MMNATTAVGSYRPGEVEFLLRPMQLEDTPLEERERLIQSGRTHYSEMIGPEDAPTRERLSLFRQCLNANGARFAADLSSLADTLAASATAKVELTLVSIARAGTPVGVLLLHRLRRIAPRLKLAHYSISVIRDRGVDHAALSHILDRHPAESVRFIDGWTGKGTIACELSASIGAWPVATRALNPGLWVPLDVCGFAKVAASTRDYLIPSSLLGGTISGLVSRSILPRGGENGSDYHGCVPLTHLQRYDLSRWFIDCMLTRMDAILPGPPCDPTEGTARRDATRSFLAAMLRRYNLTDANRVKLGIGETVRVLLRRLPKVIILSPAIGDNDTRIITGLAALRGVPVETETGLAFDAVAVIDDAPKRTGKPEV
jgi:hypothetical protein